MQKWFGTASSNGQPVVGATALVTVRATGAPATLYEDDGTTPRSNPFTTTGNGWLNFVAANGEYDMLVTKTGFSLFLEKITIGPGSVGTADIANNSITQAKMADDSVGPDELINTAVTPGIYTMATVQVDAQGRIIAASSGAGFTTEDAQDSVGGCLADSDTIDFTYNDAGNAITAEIKDDSITESKLSSDLLASLAGLTQQNESALSSYATFSVIISTPTIDAILFGGAAIPGRYGKWDQATNTWTIGTVTGPAAIVYTWAIYIPTTDVIWAGHATITHIIDPATMVATDVTATTGVIKNAVYHPTAAKVFGFVAGATAIKEMDPATGTVSRSFTYATASSGFEVIGVHPTTGALYVVTTNYGSGNRWIVIPYVAFNAVSANIATAISNAFNRHDRLVVGEDVAIAVSTSINAAECLDIAAGVSRPMATRGQQAGSIALYNSARDCAYLFAGTGRTHLFRLPMTTAYLDADKDAIVAGGASGTSSITAACIAYDNSKVYAWTNGATILVYTP